MKVSTAALSGLFMILFGLLSPVQKVQAGWPAGWSGTCVGKDYVMNGPNNSSMIWHNTARCGGSGGTP